MQHNPSRDGLKRSATQAFLAATSTSPKKGGGGIGNKTALGIRFSSNWKPPMDIPTKFRLVESTGTDLQGNPAIFHQYVDHYVKRSERGLICSKKWVTDEGGYIKDIGGKCLACSEVDHGATDINTRVVHALEGFHMAYYHLIQAKDRNTGKPLFSEYNGEKKPIMNKEECTGRGCEYCKKGVEKVLGRRVIWQAGVFAMDALKSFLSDISRKCRNCGGDLRVVAFGCPSCGEVLVTVDDSSMSDKELVIYNQTVHECPACKTVDLPDRYFECSDCNNGAPMEMYDVEFEVKRIGSGLKTQVVFSNPVVKPLPAHLEKELERKWDLSKVFQPDDFDYQAKVLKMDNPYSEGGKEQHEEYEENPSF